MNRFEPSAFVEHLIGDGYAAKTAVCYRNVLAQADVWLAARGADLDSADALSIRGFAETLPASRSSRSALRSALRAYWKASGRLDGPTGAVRVPRRRRMRCRALDEARAAALASAAARRGDAKGLCVLLGLYGGLRRNEIASLRWSDIEGAWMRILGKDDRERDVPIHPVLLGALSGRAANRQAGAAGKHSEFVFPGRAGGPANPTTIWGWVRDVGRDAGVGPVPTHVLRHTALATALDALGDLRAVMELAGHASPETTAGYTRTTARALIAAVAGITYGGRP
ncbi:MAG: tyrosine-type recombinase/integrase [Acidimicrobiales bacterium]